MDHALDDARTTLDPARRLADYRAVDEIVAEIVAEQVRIVPLYQAVTIYGVARKLRWQPTANESISLNRMAWQD